MCALATRNRDVRGVHCRRTPIFAVQGHDGPDVRDVRAMCVKTFDTLDVKRHMHISLYSLIGACFQPRCPEFASRVGAYVAYDTYAPPLTCENAGTSPAYAAYAA
jgi:hypothetical protein